MRQITRYILVQVAIASLVVVVTLSAAIWLTQSLRFVDWIVNRGLPLSTFVYIAVLVLPSFLVVVLPIAVFAAVLFTYNKMQGDSEIIVMRAVGIGHSHLVTPALIVVAAVTFLAYALNLYLLPTSYRAFKDLQFQIRNSYSGVLLQEGVFTPLDRGMTIFVREQGARGELLGLMVHDDRQAEKPVTMVAESGAIVNTPEGPRIIMRNGNRQELSRADGRVSFLFFDRYTIDIDRASGADGSLRQRETTERYIGELLNPEDVTDPKTRAALLADGHQRLATPLYVPAFVMVALACLLSGDFARRGQARRVILAVALVVAIQAMGIALGNLAGKVPVIIPLLYLNAILPTAAAVYILAFGVPRFGPPPPQSRPEAAAV